MLYFISVWTLLLIGCCGGGLGLLNLLEISILRHNNPISRTGDRAIIAVWLGMLTLAIMLLVTALLLPLSPLIGGGILMGALLLSLRSQSTRWQLFALFRRISRFHLVIYLSVAIAIAALFSQPVHWDDTGLYHYSLIRWFANFGTVPGLALLFPNLGFTSGWFAFSAPLNPDWFSDRTSATANGFVLLLAVLQLLISIGRLVRQRAQLSDWFVAVYYSFVLLVTIGMNFMTVILVSPSPDIPALLLVLVVVWTILTVETAARSHQYTPEQQIMPLLLAFGAISIKLITLPLLFMTGLWFIFRDGFNYKVKQRIGLAALGSLLLIPFLLSSIVTSGCPLYPSSTFCLDLPWAVGEKTAIANSTHSWITWYGTPPTGINQWLWAFQYWIKESGSKVMIVMIVISVGGSIYLLKTPSRSVGNEQLHRISSSWLIAIATGGIGFFLLTSPFNRFMLPYLFLVPALALATYCRSHFSIGTIFAKLPTHLTKTATIVMLAIAAITTVIKIQTTYSMLILPPSINQVATVERQVNDVTYFSPVNDPQRCWTIKLPCAYTPEHIRLRHPSQGLKAGFIRSY